MRTKLLRRLRKEAKRNVFLIPISGDIDRCVVEEDVFNPDSVWGGKWVCRYHFTDEIGQDREEDYIPRMLRYKSKHFYRPYTFNEACKLIDKLRREYIIKKAQDMRMNWNKSKEVFRTWVWKFAI